MKTVCATFLALAICTLEVQACGYTPSFQAQGACGSGYAPQAPLAAPQPACQPQQSFAAPAPVYAPAYGYGGGFGFSVYRTRGVGFGAGYGHAGVGFGSNRFGGFGGVRVVTPGAAVIVQRRGLFGRRSTVIVR